MTTERVLSDEMMLHQHWRQAAMELRADACGLQEEAEYHGEALVGSVVNGIVSLSELRGGVVWANVLDQEANQRSAGAIETLAEADYLEALARRVAHHSGRFALDRLKSKQRRLQVTVGYYERW